MAAISRTRNADQLSSPKTLPNTSGSPRAARFETSGLKRPRFCAGVPGGDFSHRRDGLRLRFPSRQAREAQGEGRCSDHRRFLPRDRSSCHSTSWRQAIPAAASPDAARRMSSFCAKEGEPPTCATSSASQRRGNFPSFERPSMASPMTPRLSGRQRGLTTGRVADDAAVIMRPISLGWFPSSAPSERSYPLVRAATRTLALARQPRSAISWCSRACGPSAVVRRRLRCSTCDTDMAYYRVSPAHAQ